MQYFVCFCRNLGNCSCNLCKCKSCPKATHILGNLLSLGEVRTGMKMDTPSLWHCDATHCWFQRKGKLSFAAQVTIISLSSKCYLDSGEDVKGFLPHQYPGSVKRHRRASSPSLYHKHLRQFVNKTQ